jgi:UvrD-like helicase C-terminal domain
MTLHAAKGLEFPYVFIIGLEQGILPHSRSFESASETEEERRLLFVGITRARKELALSFCRVREFRGQRTTTIPSYFMAELPEDSIRYRNLSETSEWTPRNLRVRPLRFSLTTSLSSALGSLSAIRIMDLAELLRSMVRDRIEKAKWLSRSVARKASFWPSLRSRQSVDEHGFLPGQRFIGDGKSSFFGEYALSICA